MFKNFSLSTGYLIDEVYPKTRVDADIIVNKVENDIIRKQNYILYQLLENLEKSKGTEWPPVVEPVIYYA